MNKTILLTSLFVVFMLNVSEAGSITGKVVYQGEAPKFREIKMEADPICLSQHAGPVLPQTLVLGEGNTMANVFVHVTSGLPQKTYEAPKEPVVLDQKGCMYDPHMIGVIVGRPLKILNPDGTLHNVHGTPKVNEEFNLAMPKFRTEMSKTFSKPEFMFSIKCDVHPWMVAWISVMDNPYFSVTKQDGLFEIKDLPAGKYEIEAWHEKLGPQKVVVELNEGETKTVNFTFSRPKEEAK